MQEQPESAELLDAVITLLREEVVPALEGRLAFDVRVAARAAGIVKRELEQGPRLEREARDRLRQLLGMEGAGIAELNEALCERLAAGELGLDDAALVDHLWQCTLQQLAIDQPRYPGYLKALEQLQHHERKGDG